MIGAIPPLPHYVVTALHLVKHRDTFTLKFVLEEQSAMETADACGLGSDVALAHKELRLTIDRAYYWIFTLCLNRISRRQLTHGFYKLEGCCRLAQLYGP
jgi:hypothetical protein